MYVAECPTHSYFWNEWEAVVSGLSVVGCQ